MSKADKRRKRAARNAKRLELAGCGLAETPKREPTGRPSRAGKNEAPEKTALQARHERFGGDGSRKAKQAMRGPHMSAQIGFVLEASCGKSEVDALWQTFRNWCAAEEGYRRRYLGQSEFAKTANYGAVVERMETDQSHSVDLRDGDEKDRDAVSRWMRWQGYLGHLSAPHRTALHDARLERKDLWQDRKPTRHGYTALHALKDLHIVVEGKKGR